MFVKINCILAWCCLLCIGCLGQGNANRKQPVVVITDCYHPYQDPGDNLDLIQAFARNDINLLAVILDISGYFRKDTADHPTLWKDPRGPREAGIIPVEQLNYIFNRDVPFAVGPMQMMKSEHDKMLDASGFEQSGIALFLKALRESSEPVEVLSFGSARMVAVAFNRDSALLKKKIKRVHVSAGTASRNYELGSDAGANMIPGGEWNVALDVYSFTRVLRSGLPVALYPCAGKDGGFVKDVNNTFYYLNDLSFLKELHPKLQCYLDYAFDQRLQHDFLRAMDGPAPYSGGKKIQFEKFSVWETAIWLEVLGYSIVKTNDRYELAKGPANGAGKMESGLRSCRLTEIRDDGRFRFEYAGGPSNISIYYRNNVNENEKALNQIVPAMYKSYGDGLK